MILGNMAVVAQECLKHPGRTAVWSPELKHYVCPELMGDDQPKIDLNSDTHPPVCPLFKLIFLTAAGGTLLFAVVCIVLTFLSEGVMPDIKEKMIMGFFDLVKIGFGAVVGLLGGQQLQAKK